MKFETHYKFYALNLGLISFGCWVLYLLLIRGNWGLINLMEIAISIGCIGFGLLALKRGPKVKYKKHR